MYYDLDKLKFLIAIAVNDNHNNIYMIIFL